MHSFDCKTYGLKPNTALSLFIFLFVLGTHFLSETVTITDSKWVMHTSLSIIRHHDTNLDEYTPLIESEQNYGVERVNEHYYYYFPVGTPLLITPLVKLVDFVSKHVFYSDIDSLLNNKAFGGMELLLASILVAICSVFVFLFCFEITGNKWTCLLLTFIFAFCTPMWSTASRALWSHGPSALFLSITLLCLLRSQRNYMYLIGAGGAVAFSYVIRPTNSVAVLMLSIYVLYTYRKQWYYFAAGALLVFVPFVAYNWHIYHNFLSPYFLPNRVGGNQHLAEGLLGNLFSPNRGLFIFSPILILSIAGIALKVWRKTFNVLDACILSIILLHYYIISSISTLYGGWCFGPRLFTDVLPFFLYFLAYFIHGIPDIRQALLHKFAMACICILICTSFFIHYRGATRPATFMWNGIPNNIDEHPERIWQWSDLQFLR